MQSQCNGGRTGGRILQFVWDGRMARQPNHLKRKTACSFVGMHGTQRRGLRHPELIHDNLARCQDVVECQRPEATRLFANGAGDNEVVFEALTAGLHVGENVQ